MNYKTILAVLTTLLIYSPLIAQEDSEMRSYTKSVPVSKETSLEVSNKYGKIHITSWDKDSAYIRAEVKAFASNQSKLDKMFDGVKVNITETNYIIRAQTSFTQNINMLFESFKGMTSNLISYDSHIEINYYISIPDYLNLIIDNKYGDVYMEDNTGSLSVIVSNGTFKANSLSKNASITMTFCDATINSMASGRIDASFSDISLGETGYLKIKSISSKLDIRRAETINIESRRDKVYIGKIESLNGNSYFTDFKINDLHKDMDLTTRYGSVNTDLIENRFETITINSDYSDISLEFDQGSSYSLDIRHINTFIVLPDKNIDTEKKAINEDKKEFMTSGTVGKNPGTAKVKIDANRGNIYLK